MDELLVTLKMVDIEYNICYNGTMINLNNSNKEVVLLIANYLEINNFNWTYIDGNVYNTNNHDYTKDVTYIYIKRTWCKWMNY